MTKLILFDMDKILVKSTGKIEDQLNTLIDLHKKGYDLGILSSSTYEKIKNHPMFTIVGHFVSESDGYTLTAKDGSAHPLEAQGWNALKD